MKANGSFLLWVLIAVNLLWFLRWLVKKPEALREGGHLTGRLERDPIGTSYLLHLETDRESEQYKVVEIEVSRETWEATRPSPPKGFAAQARTLEPGDDRDEFNINFIKELNAKAVFWAGSIAMQPGARVVLDIPCETLGPLRLKVAYEERRANVSSRKYSTVAI